MLVLCLQRYSTNTKRYPFKIVFGNPESDFSGKKRNYLIFSLSVTSQGLYDFGKTLSFFRKIRACRKNSGFSKKFLGSYLLVFVEYLSNSNSKIKTKIKKKKYFDFKYRKQPEFAECFTPFVTEKI